jgi:hypothetical protein
VAKKFWEKIFFGQNLKKITFFKIGGTGVIFLLMTEKHASEEVK